MEVYRYCPDCGEEYQPHVTECVECGGVLQDRRDGDVREPEPVLPPGEYEKVVDGLTAATAERLVKRFIAAGLPVKVESVGYGLCLSARLEDRAAVLAILEGEGAVPRQPDAEVPAVGTEGGACPACGTTVGAGTVECPDCGLLLGGSSCERCGAMLSPADEACPACGRTPGEA
jgi:hypothetical protein